MPYTAWIIVAICVMFVASLAVAGLFHLARTAYKRHGARHDQEWMSPAERDGEAE